MTVTYNRHNMHHNTLFTHTYILYTPNKSDGYKKGNLWMEHLNDINYKTDICHTEIKPAKNTIHRHKFIHTMYFLNI